MIKRETAGGGGGCDIGHRPGLVCACAAAPVRASSALLARAGDQNLISDTEKMSGGSDGECGRGGGDSLELVSEFRYAAAAPLVDLCIPTYPPTIHGDLECNMGWEPRNQTQFLILFMTT